jgi:hypothetical protein
LFQIDAILEQVHHIASHVQSSSILVDTRGQEPSVRPDRRKEDLIAAMLIGTDCFFTTSYTRPRELRDQNAGCRLIRHFMYSVSFEQSSDQRRESGDHHDL